MSFENGSEAKKNARKFVCFAPFRFLNAALPVFLVISYYYKALVNSVGNIIHRIRGL